MDFNNRKRKKFIHSQIVLNLIRSEFSLKTLVLEFFAVMTKGRERVPFSIAQENVELLQERRLQQVCIGTV